MNKGEHISGFPMMYLEDMERILRPNEIVDPVFHPR